MGCGYEDDKAEFFIITFELKIVFPICLYREAIHLQRFTPTLYVMGVATYKRDDHYPICTKLHYGCLLAFVWPYYACSYTMWSFPDTFFFCLVCQPWLLGKKEKKNEAIFRTVL